MRAQRKSGAVGWAKAHGTNGGPGNVPSWRRAHASADGSCRAKRVGTARLRNAGFGQRSRIARLCPPYDLQWIGSVAIETYSRSLDMDADGFDQGRPLGFLAIYDSGVFFWRGRQRFGTLLYEASA